MELAQHLGCGFVKTDDFHSSSVAAFVESCCLLIASPLTSVTNRELENLSDAGTGFVGHSYDNLIAETQSCFLETFDELLVESEIIDGLERPTINL